MQHRNRFYFRTIIDGINVSGLTKQEAQIILEKSHLQSSHRRYITLNYKSKKWEISLLELSYEKQIGEAINSAYSIGRSKHFLHNIYSIILQMLNNKSIASSIVINTENLIDKLEQIKSQFDVREANAKVLLKSGQFIYLKEQTGKYLNIEETVRSIQDGLKSDRLENIGISVIEKEPKILFNHIKDINTVLSHFSTKFNKHLANRTNNITLAAERINGTVLLPGEIFSLNHALGPRTIKNGYKDAPTIYNYDFINNPGGGVCQVATTLYIATLKSKLRILMRCPHSVPLDYVEPGFDATIVEDLVDLKFLNNQKDSISFNMFVLNDTLNINILGSLNKPKFTVKLRSKIIEEFLPERDEILYDNTLPLDQKIIIRKPSKGLRVLIFRDTFNEDGSSLLETEQITDDIYKPIRGQIKINSASNNTSKLY